MRNPFLILLLICGALTGCTKETLPEPEICIPFTEMNPTGSWKLYAVKADPGDGSGKFMAVTKSAILKLDVNGFYADSRSTEFTRFKMTSSDSIILYNPINTNIRKLEILKITNDTLTYHVVGASWCGGPYGEKWIRANQ